MSSLEKRDKGAAAFPNAADVNGAVKPWQTPAVGVAQVMTRSVRTCGPADTLESAARSLWDADCGCLPVLGADSRIVGMITDRDICMSALWEGKPLCEITVSRVMAKHVYSCRNTDSLLEAEDVMRRYRVRRLPVLDEQGRLAGVLSINDLARRGQSEADVARTLAIVGTPANQPARLSS